MSDGLEECLAGATPLSGVRASISTRPGAGFNGTGDRLTLPVPADTNSKVGHESCFCSSRNFCFLRWSDKATVDPSSNQGVAVVPRARGALQKAAEVRNGVGW